MNFNIVVLIKQVPDTQNVGKDAMKADGTINRGVLPAIVNPEDLKALEMAIRIKEQHPEANIIVLTMGPPRATDVIREALYRGADKGILISDSRFSGSDTLATSYALSLAIKKIENVKLVFAGRQAIDGDTAQVGPQIAEKLGIPQITYAEELISTSNDTISIKRRLETGVEVVQSSIPVLITVHNSANECRYRNAKRILKFKNASTDTSQNKSYLKIETWTADDLNPEPNRLGLNGSPTKVKNIENVVLAQKESITISDNETEICSMISSLINAHIID